MCNTLPDMVYWEELTHFYEIRINPNFESNPEKTFLRFRKVYSWLFNLPQYFEDGKQKKKVHAGKEFLQRYVFENTSLIIKFGKLKKLWKTSINAGFLKWRINPMAFGYLFFINTTDEDSSTELIYARFKEKSDTCFFCSNNTWMCLVILNMWKSHKYS